MTSLRWAMLAGLCFGAWPFVMKRSGLDPFVACFILNAVTVLVVLPFFFGGRVNMTAIIAVPFLFGVAAGVLNGVGAIGFQKMIAAVQEVDMPRTILALMMTQLIVTVLGEVAVRGNPFTLNRGFAIAAAVVAIVLFTRE